MAVWCCCCSEASVSLASLGVQLIRPSGCNRTRSHMVTNVPQVARYETLFDRFGSVCRIIAPARQGWRHGQYLCTPCALFRQEEETNLRPERKLIQVSNLWHERCVGWGGAIELGAWRKRSSTHSSPSPNCPLRSIIQSGTPAHTYVCSPPRCVGGLRI